MGTLRRLILFLVLLLPVLGQAGALRVYVSVLPLQTLVEKVGGGNVAVHTMVRPGQSPATYDPTPQQIAELAGTDLYVRTGVPFEAAWMERIRSANPRMQVLDVRDGLHLRELEDHGHGAQGHDPHVWTSPPLARHMAGAIRDRLSELDPGHRLAYEQSYAAFAAELDRLDHDIHALLDGLPRREFLVFHPAWGYFADTYGLVQVAIESGGKEPGARSLAALMEQARRDGMKTVFVQPEFDRRAAAQVARALDGQVVAIDPLAADYVENLRRVARRIAGALRQ